MAIFDLYSRRKRAKDGELPDVYQYDDVPMAFRVQITHIWSEIFSKGSDKYKHYLEISKILRKEYGVYKLVKENIDAENKYHAEKELSNFILRESDIDKVIDVIELSLRYIDIIVREYNFASSHNTGKLADDAISEFNDRAREHGVGYQFVEGLIIRIDSELVHRTVVVPALALLHQKRFASAQSEFLSAHEHYRHGQMAEALIDALKSFESTMKVICDSRGWAYDKSKGASELVKVCLDNGLIPSYWQTHFSGLKSVLSSGIPTPRNKQAGNGAGSDPVQAPPRELVSYVLHMTASTILYLSEADDSLS